MVLRDRLANEPDIDPHSERFAETLNRLGEALVGHFDNEERFLRSCGMSHDDVVRHIQAHELVLDQYAQLNLDVIKNQEQAGSDIGQLMEEWSLDHLSMYDLDPGPVCSVATNWIPAYAEMTS